MFLIINQFNKNARLVY